MAEYVEVNMERSMIEFEQMRTMKLMDDDEIKEIIRRREAFEYGLVKQEKELKDYLAYIKYERGLLALIEERLRHSATQPKLEQSITAKIKRIYELAIARYWDRERLWDEYILFGLRMRFDPAAIRMLYARMRKFHADKPDCWLKAVRWERSDAANASRLPDASVRETLTQAIRAHPTNTLLRTELMNMILSGGAEEEPLPVRAQKAQLAYEIGARVNATLAFRVAMLEEVSRHSFAGNLQQRILSDMREHNLTEPLFWHVLAQRELNGLVTFGESPSVAAEAPATEAATATNGGEESTATTAALSSLTTKRTRAQIERCVQVYEAAVAELDSSDMWSYYLDAMLMLNRGASTAQRPLRRRLLGRAYKRADAAGRMSVQHYEQYVDILYAVKADAAVVEEILQRAVKLFVGDTNIWTALMRHYIRQGDVANVRRVFRESRTKLLASGATASATTAAAAVATSGGQPLCDLYLQTLLTDPMANAAEIQETYEWVTLRMNPAFDKLKVDYLEWKFRQPDDSDMSDIDRVRAAYRAVRQNAHPCYDMMAKMAELESLQMRPNLTEWRSVLRDATQYYGKERVDVWMNWIRFEVTWGNPMAVSRASEEAKHSLRKELVAAFEAERELLQMGGMAIK